MLSANSLLFKYGAVISVLMGGATVSLWAEVFLGGVCFCMLALGGQYTKGSSSL